MKTVLIIIVVLCAALVLSTGYNDEASAVRCFLIGEQISGLNKICYYDCLGSRAAITVSSVSLCPLGIDQ